MKMKDLEKLADPGSITAVTADYLALCPGIGKVRFTIHGIAVQAAFSADTSGLYSPELELEDLFAVAEMGRGMGEKPSASPQYFVEGGVAQ